MRQKDNREQAQRLELASWVFSDRQCGQIFRESSPACQLQLAKNRDYTQNPHRSGPNRERKPFAKYKVILFW